MKKYVLVHYTILIFALIISLYFAYMARGHKGTQLLIGGFVSFFYVVWGILHHKASGDLHNKIVLEYVLIGLLSFLLLLTLVM